MDCGETGQLWVRGFPLWAGSVGVPDPLWDRGGSGEAALAGDWTLTRPAPASGRGGGWCDGGFGLEMEDGNSGALLGARRDESACWAGGGGGQRCY